jgi:hypothetical protein
MREGWREALRSLVAAYADADTEVDDAQLVAAVRRMLDDLDPARRRLSPLEAQLVTESNAMRLKLAKAIDPKLAETIEKLDPVAQAALLTKNYKEHPSYAAAQAVLEMLHARQVVVQLRRVTGAGPEHTINPIIGYLRNAVGRDFMNSTDPVPPVRGVVLAFATQPDPSRLLLIYSVLGRPSYGVDAESRMTETSSQGYVAVILNAAKQTIETRGNDSDATRAVDRLLHDIKRGGGPELRAHKLVLTREQLLEFKKRVVGRIRREEQFNSNPARGSVAHKVLAMAPDDDGDVDLLEAGNYPGVDDGWDRSRWFMTFRYLDTPYRVWVSVKSGGFQFTQGKTTEDVIRFVLETAQDILSANRRGP